VSLECLSLCVAEGDTVGGETIGGLTHSMCVSVVGPEVQGHGTDDSQLRGHLLHPPEPSLLL